MEKRLITVSKYLAKYLRHAPHELGLTLQPGGWVLVDDLLAAAQKHGFPIFCDELVECVETNNKQRFAFDVSGELIRANQGHSVEVDLQLAEREPPDLLYHGTVGRFIPSILELGLLPGKRHHVHLSGDVETARKVGERRGMPVILTVDARRMHRDGHKFYLSANGVWLTDSVPPGCLWTGPSLPIDKTHGEARETSRDETHGRWEKGVILGDYRHLSVKELGNVLLARLIDLERALWITDVFSEMAVEFHELATRHPKCPLVVDLECRDVSDTERLFCVLVRFHREVKQVDGTFKLCNVSVQVLDAMSAIRLTRMFPICDPPNDAMESSDSYPMQ